MIELGKFERVAPRDVWATEAEHFTPWFAREDNLRTLGQAIVIDLELEAQEKSVGAFPAHILCKDIITQYLGAD